MPVAGRLPVACRVSNRVTGWVVATCCPDTGCVYVCNPVPSGGQSAERISDVAASRGKNRAAGGGVACRSDAKCITLRCVSEQWRQAGIRNRSEFLLLHLNSVAGGRLFETGTRFA